MCLLLYSAINFSLVPGIWGGCRASIGENNSPSSSPYRARTPGPCFWSKCSFWPPSECPGHVLAGVSSRSASTAPPAPWICFCSARRRSVYAFGFAIDFEWNHMCHWRHDNAHDTVARWAASSASASVCLLTRSTVGMVMCVSIDSRLFWNDYHELPGDACRCRWPEKKQQMIEKKSNDGPTDDGYYFTERTVYYASSISGDDHASRTSLCCPKTGARWFCAEVVPSWCAHMKWPRVFAYWKM